MRGRLVLLVYSLICMSCASAAAIYFFEFIEVASIVSLLASFLDFTSPLPLPLNAAKLTSEPYNGPF